MADEILIEAAPRTVIGKQVKQLRREGLVPAVIYGQNEPESIQVDSLKTYLTLRDADANAILTLEINGKKRSVLARNIQRHLTRGDLLHVDFMEVSKDTMIRAEAAIHTRGKSIPEQDGLGNTSQLLFNIEIEAPADQLISEVVVDLEQIKTPDDVILVSDLEIPDGVQLHTQGDLLVAKFDYHRTAEELEELEAPIEEGEEVEVVTEREEEEAEAEEE